MTTARPSIWVHACSRKRWSKRMTDLGPDDAT
jgi:hypothetical protein